MAKNKEKKQERVELEGQLTIWDIEITEKPTPLIEIELLSTEFLSEIAVVENEKYINPLELTDMQQEFLKKNDVMKNENLSRLIIYCGGGLGIETKENNEFLTIYVSKYGKEEFKLGKSSVLPMDKILYYKEEFKANELQENNLKVILADMKTKVKCVIHRKGDENIIVELEDKVISIIPRGWVLEFRECNAIYEADEIIEDMAINILDIKTLQKNVKVGDVVEASYGKELITGEICRVYGQGNETLNIIFDNGTKHTAICRSCVRDLIKSA
jgi:hypothetical protein